MVLGIPNFRKPPQPFLSGQRLSARSGLHLRPTDPHEFMGRLHRAVSWTDGGPALTWALEVFGGNGAASGAPQSGEKKHEVFG